MMSEHTRKLSTSEFKQINELLKYDKLVNYTLYYLSSLRVFVGHHNR